MDRILYKEADGDITCRSRDFDKVFPTLYAYEETGMTPEDILKMIGKDVAFEVNKICTIEGTSLPRLRELAEADREGRIVIIPPPAKEGDPKPSCFFNDNGSLWCNGMAPVDGDEPTERCKQCWYCEFGYDALKEE